MSDWTHAAACRNHPTVRWFPTRGESSAPAKRICATCPVLIDCLDDALAAERHSDRYGIFGGLTPRERSEIEPTWLTDQRIGILRLWHWLTPHRTAAEVRTA